MKYSLYPCDFGVGDGAPRGWHYFEFSNGVSICKNCGAPSKHSGK